MAHDMKGRYHRFDEPGSSSSPMVIWSVSGHTWTVFGLGWLMVTVFFTYAACLHQGHCSGLPLWSGPWDSLSHSWEDFPGNYLSRFVVGYTSDMVVGFHVMLYVANTLGRRVPSHHRVPNARKCRGCCTNEVLLGLGLMSEVFCSIVGAICDADDDPQCMGNNTIHSTSAILWLVCWDAIGWVMACAPEDTTDDDDDNDTGAAVTCQLGSDGGGGRGRAVSLATAAGLGVLLAFKVTIRTLKEDPTNHPQFQNWDNMTILGELFEMVITTYFMVHTAARLFGSLRWAATVGHPADASSVTVASARALAWSASVLLVGACALAYAIAVATGQVAPWPHVPTVASVFAHKPTNWVGRWALVQASHALLWTSLFSQAAERAGSSAGGRPAWAQSDKAAFALNVAASAALAAMGVVNESENARVHGVATALFFGCADAAALVQAGVGLARGASVSSPAPATKAVTVAAAVAAPGRWGCRAAFQRASVLLFGALLAARAAERLGSFEGGGPRASAAAQWLNLLALAVYWVLNVVTNGAAESMGLVVLIADQAPSKRVVGVAEATAAEATVVALPTQLITLV